ncbi:E3 SUMO-protein ligase ZBED1-like [Centruroides vittatus]|uniref:E3 SUMO-protein ligase ZBED1-like n=1 Tax=Centruroides vittatus TaxID=120091 RepID=UPI00350EAB70
MKTYVLECFQYSEQDTALFLAKELKRVCTEWNVHDKISAVITDSTDNITSAIKIIGWKLLPCFAHNLDSIVQNALTEIRNIQNKIKTVIEYFQKSPEAIQRLKQVQSQMDLESLTLKQDMINKWCTTYDMFDSVLKVKDALLSTLTTYYPHVNFTNDDVTVLKEVCEILKVFKHITEEMISEKDVMASKIILFVNALRKICSQFVTSDNSPEVVSLVEKLSESINKNFKDVETNNVYTEATLLDPRFKKYGFSDKKHFEAAKKSVVAAIVKNIPPPANTPEKERRNNGNSIWDFFDTCVAEMNNNSNPTTAALAEVDKYLDEPLLPRQSNPLIWWEERKAVYPRLYEYTKKRLCVVGTSVPSEYLFSKSGQAVIEKRNRLKGQKVSQIIFLNANI